MFYSSAPWGNAPSGPWLDPTRWLDYSTLHDEGAKGGAANPQRPSMLQNPIYLLAVFNMYIYCTFAVSFTSAALNRCISGICSTGDKRCFNVLPPFLCLFGLARFPSFCHASFSLCFTAGPQGRGACLLTLSPEGSGISESKYVPMATIREETMACLLAYAGVRWGSGSTCCNHTSAPFTTVALLSRV